MMDIVKTLNITNDHWEFYDKKYGKLILTIAKRISGDPMLADIEENCADLRVAALNSIYSYARKEGLKSFDEFIDSKGFDAYTKTVLWNLKAKKGKELTKRMPFRNSVKSIHTESPSGEEVLWDIEDTKTSTSGTYFADFLNKFGKDAADVAKRIVTDPDTVTSDGRLKKSSIEGMSQARVNKAVDAIKKEINYEKQ
jgi:hypothetical protein